MGCTTCKCEIGLSNTGFRCTPKMQIPSMFIIVPIYDDAGARNGITIGDTLDQTYFDDLINQADASKRWFPLPQMKNVLDERGENIVQTFDDQTTAFIQEGARKVTAMLVGVPVRMKEKIEAARCVQVGVYVIDKNGNLIGEINSDRTILYPIKLDQESLYAKVMKPTAANVQMIELGFNFDSEAKDENLEMITCEELAPVELLNITGLVDVCPEYSGIDNDTFTVKLKTEYGSPTNPVVVKGLVQADFALRNVDDDAAVAITGLTEDPDGTYTLEFAAQTNGEELELTITKDGFDFTCVFDELIPMPLT